MAFGACEELCLPGDAERNCGRDQETSSGKPISAYDVAKSAGIIGSAAAGPANLSTNARYFRGFGKKNDPLKLSFRAKDDSQESPRGAQEPAVSFANAMSYAVRVLLFGALILFTAMVAAQTAVPPVRIRITMEREGSGMDLSSPQYKLTLEGDGSVVFDGKRNVSAMGMHRRRIDPQVVKDLAQDFVQIGYFEFSKYLSSSCEDGAVVLSSVTIENRTNEVYYLGCDTNPELDQLEEKIDQVTDSKVWIRGHLRLWLRWPWFHSHS